MSSLGMFACFAGAAFTLAAGDYLSKRWAVGSGLTFLAFASLCYAVAVAVGWFIPLRHNPHVVRISLMWNCAVMLASLSVGFLILGERLTAVQAVGAVFAVISLVLLAL